jgi:hypothetical protein
VNEYTKVAEEFYVHHGRVSFEKTPGPLPIAFVKPFTRELSELIEREVKKALARAAESAHEMDRKEYP